MKRVLAMILVLTMALGLGAVPVLAAEEAAAPAVGVTYGFEETVLVDTGDVKVTVLGFEINERGRPTFELLFENGSGKNLSFSIRDTYLDGRRCDCYGGLEDVPAGKQAYSDVYWREESLADSGISYVNNVKAELRIRTNEDEPETLFDEMVEWSSNAVSDTPALADLASGSGFGEVPVLSGDYTAVIKDFDPDGPWDDGEPAFTIYLENNTEKDVMFMAENVSINGTMCDPYWQTIVAAGTSLCDDPLFWSEDALEEAHVASIETVELEIVAMDLETLDELARGQTTVDLTGAGTAEETAEKEAALAAEEEAALAAEEEAALAAEEEAALAAEEEAALAVEEEAALAAEEEAALAVEEEPAALPAEGTAEGFEPVVLVDSDDIAVTVTAYDPDGGSGPAFEFLLENKTDQELVFNTQGVAVNDVMLSCWLYETVEPNSEMNSRMDLFGDASEKQEKGIRYVQDMQAYLIVSGESGAVYADLVSWSVPGTGDGGPAVEVPASDSSFEPIEVFSGDVAVTVTDATYAPGDALRIKFAVKNDMDEIMRAYATDIKINGAAIDTIAHSWSATVLPGAMNSKSFSLTAEDIQEIGAGTVETVDFGMAVSDLRWGEVINEGQFTLDVNSLAPAPEPEPEPTVTPAPTEDPAAEFTEERFEEELETSDPVTLSTGGETVVAVLPDDQFFEQFTQKSNLVAVMEYSDDRGIGWGRAYLRLENESDPAAYVAETVSYYEGIKQDMSSEDAVPQTTEPVTETINGIPVTWAKITEQSVNLFGQQVEQVNYYAAAPAGRFLVTAEVDYSYMADGGIPMDDSIVTDIYENIFTGESAAEAAEAKAAEAAEYEQFVVLADENGALMAVTEFEPDGNSAALELYLENNTDSTVLFSIDGAAVNGVYYDPFWSEEVGPQSSGESTVRWDAGRYADMAALLPDLADVAEAVAAIERFEVIDMELTAQVKDTEETLFSGTISLDVTDEYDD